MSKQDIINLYKETELTLEQLGNKFDKTRAQISWIIDNNFSVEYRRQRKKISYRNSKLGDKNPMRGKTGKLHHLYKGDISDGKGYIIVLKPDWYTGRSGSNHIFKHHVIMCEMLNITEIPEGCCVHHNDYNKLNNKPENLTLMTNSEHSLLHQHLKRISK